MNMPSEWAYEIAREQRRDVETMAKNLDAAREEGRLGGLEEAMAIAFAEPGSLSAFDKIRAHIRELKASKS